MKMTTSLPPQGTTHLAVPIVPMVPGRVSNRGGPVMNQPTYTYTQARVGNPKYTGGMEGYVSNYEQGGFFTDQRVKKGNQGVFDSTRWAPVGAESYVAQGIGLLSETKNEICSTRGISGGPRRQDYVGQNNYHMRLRPGQDANYAQQNTLFPGIREDRKRLPSIEREIDHAVIKQLETNPFAIKSHGYFGAKEQWEKDPSVAVQTQSRAWYNGNWGDKRLHEIVNYDASVKYLGEENYLD